MLWFYLEFPYVVRFVADIQELKVSKGIALQDILTEVHLFLHRGK